MKFVWDLDGVFRDINEYLVNKYGGQYPTKWDWNYQDMDIYEAIKKDSYRALLHAPATDYLYTAEKVLGHLTIWSNQVNLWKAHTKLWLDSNVRDYSVKYMTTKEKREALDKDENLILFEDNPNFSHYRRIIIIDRPYNKHLTCQRVSTAKQLKNILEAQKE